MIDRIKSKINYLQVTNFSKKQIKSKLNRPIVSFCFDDFAKSSWTNGGAILKKYNGLGSWYFCADFCNKTINNKIYYDEKDLRDIHLSGNELGCHTASHFELPDGNMAMMHQEINKNRKFFQSIFPGEELSTFAYPCGKVNLMSKRYIKKTFAASRGVWGGVNSGYIDLGLLQSVCLETHRLKERSVDLLIQDAIKTNGWLIFTTHDIEPNHTYHGITPEEFETIVKKVSEAGIEMLPIKNAADLVSRGP